MKLNWNKIVSPELGSAGIAGEREAIQRHASHYRNDATGNGQADFVQQESGAKHGREPHGAFGARDHWPEEERQRADAAVTHWGPHPLHPGTRRALEVNVIRCFTDVFQNQWVWYRTSGPLLLTNRLLLPNDINIKTTQNKAYLYLFFWRVTTCW